MDEEAELAELRLFELLFRRRSYYAVTEDQAKRKKGKRAEAEAQLLRLPRQR
jgi:hypothetical protein